MLTEYYTNMLLKLIYHKVCYTIAKSLILEYSYRNSYILFLEGPSGLATLNWLSFTHISS